MKNSYHVVKNSNGGWDAKKPGSLRSSFHGETQKEVENVAKGFLSNSGGGEVIIHGLDGKIRDSDTVCPGNDPNPPKDKKY
ncbi:MAG: DUF2188 domain-containing protein [Clostridia bacterium]|nr:DUF2188 domain-containing protein [Clostridia bacterium]